MSFRLHKKCKGVVPQESQRQLDALYGDENRTQNCHSQVLTVKQAVFNQQNQQENGLRAGNQPVSRLTFILQFPPYKCYVKPMGYYKAKKGSKVQNALPDICQRTPRKNRTPDGQIIHLERSRTYVIFIKLSYCLSTKLNHHIPNSILINNYTYLIIIVNYINYCYNNNIPLFN